VKPKVALKERKKERKNVMMEIQRRHIYPSTGSPKVYLLRNAMMQV
jgi:hypothetical protein